VTHRVRLGIFEFVSVWLSVRWCLDMLSSLLGVTIDVV
jgi:hypothetical protein